MNKRGEILIENVIFIILNVVFITILIVFLWKQGSGAVLMEQGYAKQISLLIDSSKAPMEIKLNMDKAFDLAKENEVDEKEIVTIKGNLVSVKLSPGGGYQYSFFNNVNVNAYPDNVQKGVYIFVISEKD